MEDLFRSFARRQALNENLNNARRANDEWLERQPLPPPLTALAQLEVLLKNRRNLLEQLVELDDRFMTDLLNLRSRPEEPDEGGQGP